MKIWVKIIKDEKVYKSAVYETENLSTFSGITQAFMEGAEALKLPTPVITRTKAQTFFDFNTVRFRPDDFVESVDLEMLEYEICKNQHQ